MSQRKPSDSTEILADLHTMHTALKDSSQYLAALQKDHPEYKIDYVHRRTLIEATETINLLRHRVVNLAPDPFETTQEELFLAALEAIAPGLLDELNTQTFTVTFKRIA
jgi:hypothetical protein